MLLGLGTFGISYLSRPIGGIVLGAYADKHGRKASLMISIVAERLCGSTPMMTRAIWSSFLEPTMVSARRAPLLRAGHTPLEPLRAAVTGRTHAK